MLRRDTLPRRAALRLHCIAALVNRCARCSHRCTAPPPPPAPTAATALLRQASSLAALQAKPPSPAPKAAPRPPPPSSAPIDLSRLFTRDASAARIAQTPPPAPIPAPSADGGPGGELSGVLALHNTLRARHGAGPLAWDAALASGAQAWAGACDLKHSEAKGYGENLAMGYGPSDAVQVCTLI